MDFSLYFTQLSVGCIALLPVVPWRAVGRGYYVMMLAVGLGLLAVAWFFRAATLFAPTRDTQFSTLENGSLLLYAAYLTFALGALGSFVGGKGSAGSALTFWAAGFGVLAVVFDGFHAAQACVPRPAPDPLGGTIIVPSPQYMLLAGNFLSSTLLLGSGLTAMLLGHWYLVVKDLPAKPLRTMTLLFFGGLGARLAATVTAFLLDPEGGRAVAHRSFLFVLVYGLFSLGSPIGMSWMIWGTVRIRSTQAATGILYGVVAFLLMGEAAGRFVLIKTGFPL